MISKYLGSIGTSNPREKNLLDVFLSNLIVLSNELTYFRRILLFKANIFVKLKV